MNDLHRPEDMTVSDLKKMDGATLILMQVSVLRGIIEIEQALDEAKDRIMQLHDRHEELVFTEQAISKVLAWKRHDADIAHYLRTGRFPDGD